MFSLRFSRKNFISCIGRLVLVCTVQYSKLFTKATQPQVNKTKKNGGKEEIATNSSSTIKSSSKKVS